METGETNDLEGSQEDILDYIVFFCMDLLLSQEVLEGPRDRSTDAPVAPSGLWNIRNAVDIGEPMRPEKVRKKKVREAREKMFRLVDDPVAICVACDKLVEVLDPHPDPEQSQNPAQKRGFFYP